jgi:hypothetical protein
MQNNMTDSILFHPEVAYFSLSVSARLKYWRRFQMHVHFHLIDRAGPFQYMVLVRGGVLRSRQSAPKKIQIPVSALMMMLKMPNTIPCHSIVASTKLALGIAYLMEA